MSLDPTRDPKRLAEIICNNLEKVIQIFMTPTIYIHTNYFAEESGARIGMKDIRCTNYDSAGWYCTGLVYVYTPTYEGPVGTFTVSVAIPPYERPIVVITVTSAFREEYMNYASVTCYKHREQGIDIPHKLPPPMQMPTAPTLFGIPTAPVGTYPTPLAPWYSLFPVGPPTKYEQRAQRLAQQIVSETIHEALYGKSGFCTGILGTYVGNWCNKVRSANRDIKSAISDVYECVMANPDLAARCYLSGRVQQEVYGVKADELSPICLFSAAVALMAYHNALPSDARLGDNLECEVSLDKNGRVDKAVATDVISASTLSMCTNYGMPKHLLPASMFSKSTVDRDATIMCIALYVKRMFDDYKNKTASAIATSLTSLWHIARDTVLDAFTSYLCGVKRIDLINAVASFIARLPEDDVHRTCIAYGIAIGAMTRDSVQKLFKPKIPKGGGTLQYYMPPPPPPEVPPTRLEEETSRPAPPEEESTPTPSVPPPPPPPPPQMLPEETQPPPPSEEMMLPRKGRPRSRK